MQGSSSAPPAPCRMERIKSRQQKFRRGKEELLSLKQESLQAEGRWSSGLEDLPPPGLTHVCSAAPQQKEQKEQKEWWRPWVNHASSKSADLWPPSVIREGLEEEEEATVGWLRRTWSD